METMNPLMTKMMKAMMTVKMKMTMRMKKKKMTNQKRRRILPIVLGVGLLANGTRNSGMAFELWNE